MVSFLLCLIFCAKISCGFSLTTLQARCSYIKNTHFKKKSIHFIKLSYLQTNPEKTLLSEGEDKIFYLPACLSSGSFIEKTLLEMFKRTYDTAGMLPQDLDEAFQNFVKNIKLITDLQSMAEHTKQDVKKYPYLYNKMPLWMTKRNEADFKAALAHNIGRVGQIRCDADGTTYFWQQEGLTLRSLIAIESVFEDQNSIKLIIGPRVSPGLKLSLNPLKIERSVDNLNLSLDYLVRAGIVSERSGGKPIELLVVGTQGITEADIQKQIDQIIGDGEKYNRQVGAALPNERHSALMGGVGLSAGYHYHTKNFIFNMRSGVDHIWGKFRQTGPQNIDTENMPKLGWGVTLGAGVDYKFTEKSTIGLEGGVRLSEFKIPMQDNPTSTKSSWFMAPYAQIVCGFYPTPDYSVSVFTGYFFPRTFAVKAEGTRITEGTKCTVDGIFGGLKFSRYF